VEWWKWRLIPYPWRYENHDDHCDPRNQPIPLLANIVNLGVLVFLIVRFGRKPVAEALKQRRSGIMSEIEKARAIRTGAQSRLDRYEDDLEHLDEKLAALREQYALEGVREEKRAVRDTGEARDRMMADAEFRVAQEGKTARDELSSEALEAALMAAERLLSTSVTQADHDRLAEEYLSQIGEALKSSDGGEA
jgi:F-type H+-transporting ATPase subunit b